MQEKTKLLEELAQLSNFYGRDPDCVLAGGGNTSVKIGDVLYIKGSGTELAAIRPEQFVPLDRAKVQAILAKTYSADPLQREEEFKDDLLAARIDPASGARPSVETCLHEVFQEPVVVHIHPWIVGAVACAKDGRRIVEELFGDRALWVEFNPGYLLARAAQRRLKVYRQRHGGKDPDFLIAQNHGPFIPGASTAVVRRRIRALCSAIERRLAPHARKSPLGKPSKAVRRGRDAMICAVGPAIRGLLGEGRQLPIAPFDDSPLAMEFVATARGKAALLGGPLSPDQIVYCRSFPLWVPCKEGDAPRKMVERLARGLEAFRAKHGYDPKVIAVEGLGLFAVGDSIKAARTVRDVYVDALKATRGAFAAGGPHFMTRRQYEFVDQWEVESYRRKVAAASARTGRVQNKVALVTGAAQGFGREIAENLAREGACVVLADVNVAGAKSAAEGINAERGADAALAVGMDVGDSASVRQAALAVARAYGGLDILVSNAGVLRAGSVKTQPERDFDLVTQVNYRGYFLCVKCLCPLMAAQRAANPQATGDIIQINSKSGLQGSNRNFAYAGGKFGGIGLTQSFALELIEDGVKVNSICPGNFFDGPLWSDPENGLFVQYLGAGKVSGAKTIDDVRRFYESKVPMNRGCTTADVMHAIYYLIDQQYETGQALPVTGGQVMLR